VLPAAAPGLADALQAAGARTAVTGLWQTDEHTTRQVLARFYDQLWARGVGPLEALRQAQLERLEQPGGRARPWMWAGWVVSGEPGPLGPPPPVAAANRPPPPSGSAWPAVLAATALVAAALGGWALWQWWPQRPRWLTRGGR
jgi:hypothetical protein